VLSVLTNCSSNKIIDHLSHITTAAAAATLQLPPSFYYHYTGQPALASQLETRGFLWSKFLLPDVPSLMATSKLRLGRKC